MLRAHPAHQPLRQHTLHRARHQERLDPMSSRRVMAPAASFVCSVLNTG
ncbi:MAG: hypothetical protein R3B49_03775 [Phycisphaerales bacterium]